MIVALNTAQGWPIPPTTFAWYTPGYYSVGQAVLFDGSGSHSNNGINGGYTPGWMWDFHFNGTFHAEMITTSPYATYSYQFPGNYTVAVIYYDADNLQGNLYTMSITILPSNPRLLFRLNNFTAIGYRYNSTDPSYTSWRQAIDQNINSYPTNYTRACDFDLGASIRAKNFAFRAAMTGNQSDADSASKWLLSVNNPLQPGFTLDSKYDTWMITGLALQRYLQAYDILYSLGFLSSTQANLVRTKLQSRIYTLWTNVKDERYLIYDGRSDQFMFRHESGNIRIIVASALGMAALEFWGDNSCPYQDYFNFCVRDLNQFLLGNKTYSDFAVDTTYCSINSQYAGGAFPEGPSYFNYSALAFIPFILANALSCQSLGAPYQDYFHYPHLKDYFDWFLNIQMPDGSMPWINSSGNGVFSFGGILSSVLNNGYYRWQMEQSATKYYASGLEAEAICLYDLSHAPASAPMSNPIVSAYPNQGQVIFRTDNTSNATYLCLMAENGRARYGGETHSQADAGSYSIFSKGHIIAFDPGYGSAMVDPPLQVSWAHNTVVLDTNGNLTYADQTFNDLGAPPQADAYFDCSAIYPNFAYARINFDITNTIWPFSFPPGDLLSCSAEQAQAIVLELYYPWGRHRRDYRDVVLVNNRYFIITDELLPLYTGDCWGFASLIHGNNGSYNDANTAILTNFVQGQNIWTTSDNKVQLQATMDMINEKPPKITPTISYFASQHENGNNSLAYHAAMKLEASASDHLDQIYKLISLLEIESPGTIVQPVQQNLSTDNFSAYTIDARTVSYGRYDFILSQISGKSCTFNNSSHPIPNGFGPIATDAGLLVMSFSKDFSTVNVFAEAVTYINYRGISMLNSSSRLGTYSQTFNIGLSSLSKESLKPINRQQPSQDPALSVPITLGLVGYPNPFNPSMRINYQLVTNSKVTLIVYDVLGRQVAILFDGTHDAGYYTATFDGSNFVSGVYFARLSVIPINGDQPMMKVIKMSLLK